MKDYELLEQQARVMKMAEKHGVDDWRKLVQVYWHGEWRNPEVGKLCTSNKYRFALGVVGGKGVFEGDVLWHYEGFKVTATNLWGQEMFNHNGRTCYLQHLSWTPPAKDEPASRNWQDVYKWMQKKGARFEICQIHYGWSAISSKITFTADQQDYRIDLSQTPPDNWREIYKVAQEFGVEFAYLGYANGCNHAFCLGFTDYQLAAAKREEPKPKTRKVKLLAYYSEDYKSLGWFVEGVTASKHWKRSPSEDRVIEVEE